MMRRLGNLTRIEETPRSMERLGFSLQRIYSLFQSSFRAKNEDILFTFGGKILQKEMASCRT